MLFFKVLHDILRAPQRLRVALRWCKGFAGRHQSYFRLWLAHHSRSASPTKSRG